MASSYSPPVNLHSPGPIGDVTPSTLAGTTLVLASGTAPAPALMFGDPNSGFFGNGDLVYSAHGGSAGWLFSQFAFAAQEGFGQIFGGSSTSGNRVVISCGNDDGMGHPANGTISLVSAGTDKLTASATAVKVVSGNQFWLGNAATAGLVAGALAALTTASIVIYDSNGVAYRVPCITP